MRHLITGGAGFIGCNLASVLLARGEDVTILDNLSRPLTPLNLAWLQEQYGARLRFIHADIRDAAAMHPAVANHEVVYHLAGQVAVTTSVLDPRSDFEINALGTLNLLEAARLAKNPPVFFYASTNKVYGGMEEVAIVETPQHYAYRDLPNGIAETQQLNFHSPYGCSKGAADQYVHDYARIYGLKTVVFRQSCIYGQRQLGVEDQGWAAHFVIAAVTGRPIKIYGDGKQVRDMLHIDDLIAAYCATLDRIESVHGRIYNIGGGPQNTLAIWAEFGPLLERLLGRSITVQYEDWRPGDQPVYISDISKAAHELQWQPKIAVSDGVERLIAWVQSNRHIFE
ncbi:MAG: GDP-mannose 4,6-dehydratase [Chloroflexales bacterium]|nr:GDP-mannose 4,6-dehydratase [Chloroflexales bacterium]